MIKKVRMFSLKTYALILIIIGLSAAAYFLFFEEYFETQSILKDFEQRKEKIEALETDIIKKSTAYAVQTSFNTSKTTYGLLNESVTNEESELNELKAFVSIYAPILQNASVDITAEEAFLGAKEETLNQNKKAAELQYMIFSYLESISQQKDQISAIEASIETYEETEENQKILTDLYTKKLRALTEVENGEKQLETYVAANKESLTVYNFSTRMFISTSTEKWSISLDPNSLLSWIEDVLPIVTLDISEASAKIKALSNPLYNVEITPTYESEIMYGFLDQMSSFGDYPISFNIKNNRDTPINLIFAASIQEYTTEARKSVTIDAGKNEEIELSLSTLSSVELSEKKITNLQYTVYSEGKVVIEESVLVALYPKNVMIWNNNLTHGDMLIAGFVTPHAPEVKELLREAADYAPGNTLSNLCGWCSTSNDWRLTMEEQIKAIYSALKYRYDITYVNTPIAYGEAESAGYQTVYLPAESLTYKSANCMDGTVLFASALEAIDIDAYIFLVPGHSFVCYDLSPQDSYDYLEQCLETTMIGDSGFNDVIETGNDNANRATYGYVVSVKEARELGILPIE